MFKLPFYIWVMRLLIPLLTILLFLSCNKEKFPEGKLLLKASLDAHGGLQNWNKKSAISYDKRTVLFDEAGNVESDITQHILYDFDSVFSGRMWWVKDGQMHRIVFDGQNGTLTIDSLKAGNGNSAGQTFMASYVTFAQPFKLLTDQAKLTTEAIVDLEKGRKAYKVRVVYPGENAPDADKWWYFFDVENYRVLANLVWHKGRYSFIENTAYNTSTPFVFNAERKSYFTDSLLNKKYLRASYELKNIRVALE